MGSTNLKYCMWQMSRGKKKTWRFWCIKLTFFWSQVNQTRSWTPKRRCGSRSSPTCARTLSALQPTRAPPLKLPARECAEPKLWATADSNEMTELLEIAQCLLGNRLRWWPWWCWSTEWWWVEVNAYKMFNKGFGLAVVLFCMFFSL